MTIPSGASHRFQFERQYEEVVGCLRDEPQLIRIPRSLPELEIQARWFAGEFGKEFVTTDGARIQLLQPGTWNREAGPDFVDAAISINGSVPIRGAIELDREVRDWERHGHSSNPEFESVILHVFWQASQRQFSPEGKTCFTRTPGNRYVPQVFLSLSGMDSNSAGDWDRAAGTVCGNPGRCSPVVCNLPVSKLTEIIEAASAFRFSKKVNRLARSIEIHGEDEALYQSLAASLGYKSNKLPFSLLSQRLPLALLQKNKSEAAGLVFGVAGLIDSPDLFHFDPETRHYLRSLWGRWWARRADFQRLVLEPAQWRLHGLRPANSPYRRLAALLAVARQWSRFRVLVKQGGIDALGEFFRTLPDDYWAWRYSFRSGRAPKKIALVGESRLSDMIANVFLPFMAAMDSARMDAVKWDEFRRLPAPDCNRLVKVAAARLFGQTPMSRAYTKSQMYQQGLLQIFEDFCARDTSDCLRCPFPEQCIKPLGLRSERKEKPQGQP